MVDSVVSFLLENLSQLLASEAKLLYGVKDRVRSLHYQLQMIDAFLKASDGKKSKKEMEKVVANQIREVAEEAEDVIDTFVTKMTMHKRRSKLGRMIHGVHHAKLLRNVAKKIDSIKGVITDIHDSKIKYDLFQQEGESSSTREEEERMLLLHKRRMNVEEDNVVGFVHDSEVVIQQLMGKESRSNVVSIIGMGGLGKTTLARKVYNNKEVKKHFNCRAWVYMSNDCRVKELLLSLLNCLMPNSEYESRSKRKGKKQKCLEKPRDLSSLGVDDLKQMVHECLRRKRYLLVLDDLWKTQDWDEVQDAFPTDNFGSKILITNRLKEVASYTGKDPPYHLQFLNEEESWELFSKRVFCGEECPSDLEALGKQIVKSCRGLPLSIIVLTGLLGNKEKSHREWSKVVDHVNWYLTRDETQVKDIILKLSYDNLPKRLKSCFLYFGIFPEDVEIPAKPLLNRWVAEGFIQQTGTRSPEDVAEDFLYELIDRSLIQAARVKRDSGGVKTCRIHDLLRDLCISESKEDKLFEVCTDDNILAKAKPRRLSVHCSMPRYASSSINDHSCVRSLFCFGQDYSFDSTEWKWLFKYFKLVRLLDLGNIKTRNNLPSNFDLFIHLRYLRLHSKNVLVVPDSICTLQSLQTLEIGVPVGNYSPISFPGRLWKLTQLRHVYTVRPIELRRYRHSDANDEVMWNLQTISSIVLNKESACLFEKVRFPKLGKLGLRITSNLCMGELGKLLPSLTHLSHLNKLRLTLEPKDFFISPETPSDLKSMEWNIGCKPHEMLQTLQQLTHLSSLKVSCAFDLLACGVAFPPCLTKLTLDIISCINDDGMSALGNLTSLRILRLSDSFRDNNTFERNCSIAGSFPQLQAFEISNLNIHSWKLANDAMPRLQSLLVVRCEKLDSLPNELWSFTSLRQVRILEPTESLSLTLRNLEMKDECKLTIE